MRLLGPFLALNLLINSSIFLCLANVTRTRYVLATNFWMTAYAALPPLSPDGRQQIAVIDLPRRTVKKRSCTDHVMDSMARRTVI